MQFPEMSMQRLSSMRVPSRRSLTFGATRRKMARSVTNAQRAVDMTKRSGAANGDLESLSRRLRQVSLDVDRSLRIAQLSAEEPSDSIELAAQALAVTESARRIERAASAALARAHGIATSELVRDAQVEFDAITGSMNVGVVAPLRS